MLSWLAFCALALGACAPLGPAFTEPALPPMRADTVGRLMVDGGNAFINGQRVQGGNYVFDGDTVSTGPATSVKLLLNDNGEIQLDENTDPLFKQGACLLMRILRGRVAFQNMKCQEFEDGLKMAGVARSYVNIMSSQNESRVTVIAGEVDMRSPTQATLRSDMQYVATSDGAAQVLQLTPEQAVATVAWTRNFFRPPVAPPPDRFFNSFPWPPWPGGRKQDSGTGPGPGGGGKFERRDPALPPVNGTFKEPPQPPPVPVVRQPLRPGAQSVLKPAPEPKPTPPVVR
jgi:hypothetical protein